MLYLTSLITTKKISTEYTQIEMRRESNCISTKTKKSTYGGSNGENEGKVAMILIEANSKMAQLNHSLSVNTLNESI